MDVTGKVHPSFIELSFWVISSSPQYSDRNSQDDMEINGIMDWAFHKAEIFHLSAVGDHVAAVRFLGF